MVKENKKLEERINGDNLKVSNLLKVLKGIPTFKSFFDEMLVCGARIQDFPEVYAQLRIAEKGYEDLKKLGVDVDDELKERRYQIAELACYLISQNIDWIDNEVASRKKLTGDAESSYGGLTLQNNIKVLGQYLDKIDTGFLERSEIYTLDTEKRNPMYPED